MSHRFFSPSASHTWLPEPWGGGCSASVVVDVSDLKEIRRASADRGHELHAESERCMKAGDDEWCADSFPPDDKAAVDACLRFVRKIDGEMRFEFQSDLIDGLCGGTADVVVVEPEPGVLQVIDYKFGTGEVEVHKNPQLMIYALCVDRALEPLGYEFHTFRLTVLQPALRSFESWDVSYDDLYDFCDVVDGRVEQIMDGDVEFAPSTDNCRFCRAKPKCPEFTRAVDAAAADDFAGVRASREALDARDAIAAAGPASSLTWEERLRLAPLLKQLADAWEGGAKALMISGDIEVSTHKVVEGRKGNRDWMPKKKRAAVDFLAGLGIGEEALFSDPKMVSPNQAEGVIKEHFGDDKEAAKEAIEQLRAMWAEGKPGAPTIAPKKDRRAEIDKEELARRDFAKYIEGGE